MDREDVTSAAGSTTTWPPMRRGSGALARESAGWGTFAVVTTASPWRLAAPRLARAPRAVATVTTLERERLDDLARHLAGAERVVGIGGGLAMDGAKYVAWRLGVPLVQVPSAASNNACFTRTSGCLLGGRRAPVREAPVPEQVIVDLDLIGQAPLRLNRAGVGDLLSSHTALHDWALARHAGRPVDWDPDLAARTRAALVRLGTLAPAVGHGDPDALLALIEMGEQFAPEFLRYSRARFNSASEHLLAWCLEEQTGRRLLHGEVVCLGVLLMAHLQGNAPETAAQVIRAARISARPEAIGTTWAEVEGALLALPAYARDVVPWYTIIDEVVRDGGRQALLEASRRARAFVERLDWDTREGHP